jgi:small redox-active disulfide protein 2
MLKVKILGGGCPNCKRLEAETRKAAAGLAIEAEYEKVTDYQKILAYDVLQTPGLVINEKVVASGRIPSQAELTTMLADALSG